MVTNYGISSSKSPVNGTFEDNEVDEVSNPQTLESLHSKDLFGSSFKSSFSPVAKPQKSPINKEDSPSHTNRPRLRKTILYEPRNFGFVENPKDDLSTQPTDPIDVVVKSSLSLTSSNEMPSPSNGFTKFSRKKWQSSGIMVSPTTD